MNHIDCSSLYLPFLSRALGYVPTCLAQCITCADGTGKPVAGVIYDGYNEVTISAHIWLDAEHRACKEWYVAIFDYPFNRLGIKKLVGQVNSTNVEAIKLDEHFGFVEEARVKDYSHEGDLIIYTMTREQCIILNSPKWFKIVERIGRVQ